MTGIFVEDTLLWIFTRLEIKRCRPKTKIGQYLGQVTDREKSTGKHIRVVRMRIGASAARLLFSELVNSKMY